MEQGLPDDSDGNALKFLLEGGSDLSKPMDLDFAVLVPDEATGMKYAALVAPLGFRTEVDCDFDSNAWTCYCSRSMVPLYNDLISIQNELDALARPFGGRIDGWGSFGNAPEKPK